jgi:hypothetical protein
MEEDRRVLHNVHIGGVDNHGEVTLTFHQFTDVNGLRHMPGRAIHVKVNAKMPILMALDVAHAQALQVASEDEQRRAPLPARTVTIE